MNAKQLARDRLERDIRTAIREGAALHACFTEDAKAKLDTVLRAESHLVSSIVDHLDRHYRVTQRARPERTAT